MVQVSALRQAVLNRINELPVSRSVHNLRQNLKSDLGNPTSGQKIAQLAGFRSELNGKIDLYFSLGESARLPQTLTFDPDLTTA